MGPSLRHTLDSLGWAVLHALWQVALVFLIVWIWRSVVRRRSPALSHAGSLIGMIACLGAFLFTFAVYLIEAKSGLSGSGATLPVGSPESGGEINVLTGWIAPFEERAGAALDMTLITPILACLWALGFAAMSLRYAFSFGQAQQLRVMGIAQPSDTWAERFSALLKETGLSDGVKLLISANVSDPVTLGLFKPVVLVPIGFLTGLPADQVEAVLRHELAHIKRHDYALNLLQTGIKTVLFFHPAIHIMSHWAEQDREQACDDLAIREGHDPLLLVRGLAALRLQNTTPSMAMAALGHNKGGDTTQSPLMARLTRLSGQTTNQSRPEHIIMPLLSLLLIGSVYFGASLRANAHPHPVPKPIVVPDPLPMVDIAPTPQPLPIVTPQMPDTIVTPNIEIPEPPAPPILPRLDMMQLGSKAQMQDFIKRDKSIYRQYMKSMEGYAKELNGFFSKSQLDEDAIEDMMDSYVDMIDDIGDQFEDRRDIIENLYEAQIEFKEAEKENARLSKDIEEKAALIGLETAEKALTLQLEAAQSAQERNALSNALNNVRRTRADARAEASSKRASIQSRNAEQMLKQAEREAAFAREEAQRVQIDQKKLWAEAKTKAKFETEKHKELTRTHKAYRDAVMEALLKDGLIDSPKAKVHLSHPENVMSLNGEPMTKGLRDKYCKMMDAHGLSDNNTEIKISPDSLTILTDYKNGRHTTRITYGTHKH